MTSNESRSARIISRVREIPEGYVLAYGDIDRRAPCFVGRVLATHHDLPWHRVVRADSSRPRGAALPERPTEHTHDWVLFDEDNGRVVFCARTDVADPGDGSSHSATNWTRLDYAGDGLSSREEDIYNLENFVKLLKE